MDIELPITLRFGQTRLTLDQVAALDAGSVVEFERPMQDPVDLLINGSIIARGHAVTVQGKYAVRISEIVSHKERLDSGAGQVRKQGRL